MNERLQHPVAAMILAAGRGERMRPLTDSRPKPLLEVRDRPLIEWHVLRLAAAGFRRIVINLAWLGAQIRDHLGDGARYGVSIVYSEESPRALETAGGIIRALPLLSPGPFVVINGDIYTDFPFETLRLREPRPAGAEADADAGGAGEPAMDAHLVLVPNPPQHPAGDFGVDGAGLALPAAATQFTFAGIAVYRMEFFSGCTDGVLPLKPLLLKSMAVRRCTAELYEGVWEDVGTPQRLAALNAGPI
jgi:MurNAc alpha-1-phosphate uridylyltransferase